MISVYNVKPVEALSWIQQDKVSTGFTLYTEIIDFSGHRDPAG
jgi:hypothetical protein